MHLCLKLVWPVYTDLSSQEETSGTLSKQAEKKQTASEETISKKAQNFYFPTFNFNFY